MSREREELEELGKRIKREIDASSSPSGQTMRRGAGVGGIGGVLNTVTPCAACKLLRRRCAEECPFSPYFSPHEPQKFAAVHKVFGASNVSKMLLEVPENRRADTANSLVYEANVRLRDPIYGCMGAISSLQRQVQALQAELNAVRAEIFKFKFREEAANSVGGPSPLRHASHLVVPNSAAMLTQPQPQSPTTPPLVSVSGVAPDSSTLPAPSNLYTTPPSSTTEGFSSMSSDSVAYFD